MSIKILDTLEPAGKFKLVHAENVLYNIKDTDQISVADKIKELDDILNAEPKLMYTVADLTDTPVTKVELGGRVAIEFSIETTALGSCQISLDRKSYGSEEPFTRVKELTEASGLKRIELGTANALSDYIYRVYVVDSLGRTAKYNATALDGTAIKQDYLEFRIICGGVQFKSTFVNQAKSNIFAVNLSSIKYPFSMNYAATGYRWLFYSITKNNELPSENLADWYHVPIFCDEAGKAITSSGGILSTVNLPIIFNSGTFSTTGVYQIHACGAVSIEEEITDFDNLLVSAIATDNIDILEENSIGITLLSGLPSLPTNESFLSISFAPKTNVTAMQGYHQLEALCQVFQNNTLISENKIACTHTEATIWNLGRLESGENYTFRITCTGLSAKAGTLELNDITIYKTEAEGTTYEENNLMFYFDADPSYFNSDTREWQSANTKTVNKFSIKTSTLNTTQGMTTVNIGSDSASVFKLDGDAYGILYQDGVPYNPWTVLSNEDNNGFTFETYIKSKCIGTLNARAISARYELGTSPLVCCPGFSIGYDKVITDTQLVKAETPILEDTWQHVTIVIDKQTRTIDSSIITPDTTITADLIEDFNPYATMRTYIDGALTQVKPIKLDSDNLTASAAFPMVLNGISEYSIYELTKKLGQNEAPSVLNRGECEIRLMRCYSSGLTASEVYKNYLNALLANTRESVIIKNKAGLPTIYFTKNKGKEIITENTPKDVIIDINYWKDKKILNSTFATLNTIKQKKTSGNQRGSKDTFVNCTMHYFVDGTWYKEPNVDVYLQGTSSLEYPVKNYQIKVFEIVDGKRKKKNILPPGKNADNGWYTPASVYTLKCDFMEQSHRNNTPTACYYQDSVLDAVIATQNGNSIPNEKYSHARRITANVALADSSIVEVRPYRDSIDGFACIVYYNDNNSDGSDANIIANGTNYTQTNLDIYAGSYMFNVDKEGTQLGFEIGTEHTDLKVYGRVGTAASGESIWELRAPKTYDGNEITGLTYEYLPCVSFEGATNDNTSAAAFVPWEMHKQELIKTIYDSGKPLFSKTTDKANPEAKPTYTQLEPFESLEALINYLDDTDTGPVYYQNESKVYIELVSSSVYMDSFAGDPAKKAKAKYDYLAATLEPRFTFADAYEDDIEDESKAIDENVYNELTYSVLERAIDWVYYNSNDEKAFREGFSNYFSFEYCLAYYLQMITFTQTDNAGKNAMFDTWYDGRLYPRPYDMDTQMGLDNSGNDIKSPASELNIDTCTANISGSGITQEGEFGVANDAVLNWHETTSKTHPRFSAYNTSESRLWKAFGKFFSKEIAETYRALRTKGVYSVDAICQYIDDKTSNVIGEKFYNKDAAMKYLSYTSRDSNENLIYDSTYLRCLNGNRKNRYRQFLMQRLIFLDTVYSYKESVTNGSIELRVNSPDAASSIGIHVYTPQYVRIAIDSGKQADINVFVDPNDTYSINGETYSGCLFTLPTTGGDKNIIIYGAGNIRAINHTETLKLTKFDISRAIKLTDINLAGASQLATLTLGENTYIRDLNLSGTSSLKDPIDLSNCRNLETVNVSKSAITGITFASGANIKTLNLTNSGIISLRLESLSLLEQKNLILTGCNQLETIALIDCLALTSIPFKHLTSLANLTISGCPNIEEVDLSSLVNLKQISLTGDIKSLNFENCAGIAFEELNLAGLRKLTSLNMKKLSVDGSLTTPATVYLPEYSDTLDSPKLANLDLSAAIIGTLSTKSDTPTNSYDFTNIYFYEGKSKLSFENNVSVTEIKNLTYNGNLSYLFRGCKELIALENCVLSTTAENISHIFYECSKLCSIGNVSNWNLESVTSATYVFSGCTNIKYESIKDFLGTIQNVEDLGAFLLRGYHSEKIGTTDYPSIIDADFFIKNKKITNLSQCFFNTGFTHVSPGLLDPCGSTLQSANGLFAYMENLEYAPATLFKNCNTLTSIANAFLRCFKLGTIAEMTDSNGTPCSCIMTNTCDIWPSQNPDEQDSSCEIENISGMFYRCEKLNICSSDQDNNLNLYAFMRPLTKLTNTFAAFYGCKGLSYIPNGIFENNRNLVNINATFGATGLTSLPDNLFTSDLTYILKPTHVDLKLAKALFANCTKLEGIVNKRFFACAPNIENIGGCYKEDVYGSNYLAIPGMFGNTKISGFHEEFLNPLSKLIDASMLFFTGNSGSDYSFKPIKCLPNSFYIYKTVDNSGNDSIINTSPYSTYDQKVVDGVLTSTTVLSANIFINNSDLQTTSGMFSGNIHLTGFSQDLFNNNRKLRDTSAMFTKCTGLVDNDSALSILLKDLPDLTDVSHMFADCISLASDIYTRNTADNTVNSIFKGCTSLRNCCGFLMNTSITGSISANLFNDCRNTIYDVSYMFAGCKALNGVIETGSALINDPAETQNKYRQLLGYYFDQLLALEESERPEYFNNNNYSDSEADRERFIDNVVNGYHLSDDNNLPSYENYIKYNKVVDINQAGLLSDCYNLTNVHHMFSGCENLSGPIPADMFYYSKKPNSSIISLAGLFECCYHLTLDNPSNTGAKKNFEGSSYLNYKIGDKVIPIRSIGGGNYNDIYPAIVVNGDTEDDHTIFIGTGLTTDECNSVVPANWLFSLPNITNISRMFYNVGALRNTSTKEVITNTTVYKFVYSNLSLPNTLFSQQNFIWNASWAFAFMGSTGLSQLDYNFMRSSLANLKTIEGIFCCTELASIGTSSGYEIFSRSSLNSKLENVSRSFWYVNRIEYADNCYLNFTPSNTGLTDSYAPLFYNTTKFSTIKANDGAFTGSNAEPYYNDGIINNTIHNSYTYIAPGTSISATYFDAPYLVWENLFTINMLKI